MHARRIFYHSQSISLQNGPPLAPSQIMAPMQRDLFPSHEVYDMPLMSEEATLVTNLLSSLTLLLLTFYHLNIWFYQPRVESGRINGKHLGVH